MALNKAITLPSGVVVNYHKITTITNDYLSNTAVARISSFVSQEVRNDADDVSLAILRAEDISTAVDSARGAAYTALKLLPEWVDATDA